MNERRSGRRQPPFDEWRWQERGREDDRPYDESPYEQPRRWERPAQLRGSDQEFGTQQEPSRDRDEYPAPGWTDYTYRRGPREKFDWELGPHSGRGPRSYQRPKERILEEANQALHDHGWVDATDLEVACEGDGELVLKGEVATRREKRLAEECVERVSGVKDVRNEIRVRREASGDPLRASGSAQPQAGSGRATPKA